MSMQKTTATKTGVGEIMEWKVAKRNLKNSKQQLKSEQSSEGEDELVV